MPVPSCRPGPRCPTGGSPGSSRTQGALRPGLLPPLVLLGMLLLFALWYTGRQEPPKATEIQVVHPDSTGRVSRARTPAPAREPDSTADTLRIPPESLAADTLPLPAPPPGTEPPAAPSFSGPPGRVPLGMMTDYARSLRFDLSRGLELRQIPSGSLDLSLAPVSGIRLLGWPELEQGRLLAKIESGRRDDQLGLVRGTVYLWIQGSPASGLTASLVPTTAFNPVHRTDAVTYRQGGVREVPVGHDIWLVQPADSSRALYVACPGGWCVIR